MPANPFTGIGLIQFDDRPLQLEVQYELFWEDHNGGQKPTHGNVTYTNKNEAAEAATNEKATLRLQGGQKVRVAVTEARAERRFNNSYYHKILDFKVVGLGK